MADEPTKICKRCRQCLPLGSFGFEKRDERRARCRPCLTAYRREKFEALPPERQKEVKAREYESQRNCYLKNKEGKRAANRRWSANHAEAHRSMRRAWLAANPEWRMQKRAERRIRESVRDGNMGFRELKDWLKRQKKKICHWCGKKCHERFEIDHRMPLARGGRHEAKNLVISCPSCNRKKWATDPIEFAQRMGKLL